MKKRDFYLAAAIILLAGVLWAAAGLLKKEEGSTLTIFVDQRVYGTYSLFESREIAIDDTNVCVIENGKARMCSADCPDQICVHTKPISRRGETIICMPNRVVLEITRGMDREIDSVAQ